MPKCINLKTRYGKTYRISWDEAKEHPNDPWMMQIKGRKGIIYPYGGEYLCAEVDYRPKIAGRLERMGFELIQDGDEEKTFRFHVKDFDRMAEVLMPYRRPQLTEEQRETRRQAMQKYHDGS